jgi:hypothetical protein
MLVLYAIIVHMSQQLHTAMTTILAMPYFQNQAHKSGGADFAHERAVAEHIRACGFAELDRSSYPKVTKSLLKKWAEGRGDADLRKATQGMPEGTFISQPAGSQGFPDILVRDWGDRYVAVECKSGKNGQCPMWNDNTPKPLTIYVLSSGVQNATTIFMGQDVITPQQQDLMDQLERDLTAIVNKYKILVDAEDQFNRGWIQKARKQHFQAGGGAKTNYFIHKERAICEQRALDYSRS